MIVPMVNFDVVTLGEANILLRDWRHKMGPCDRPDFGDVWAHALFHEGKPVACTVTTGLIRNHVGGGLQHLKRESTVELARVCAARPGLCRVALRLWREFVFPPLGYPAAISYQDSAEHRGEIYRCDGWARSPEKSRSGSDARSGKHGRAKWIWVWPPAAKEVAR